MKVRVTLREAVETCLGGPTADPGGDGADAAPAGCCREAEGIDTSLPGPPGALMGGLYRGCSSRDSARGVDARGCVRGAPPV